MTPRKIGFWRWLYEKGKEAIANTPSFLQELREWVFIIGVLAEVLAPILLLMFIPLVLITQMINQQTPDSYLLFILPFCPFVILHGWYQMETSE